jgi:hypothetical protein
VCPYFADGTCYKNVPVVTTILPIRLYVVNVNSSSVSVVPSVSPQIESVELTSMSIVQTSASSKQNLIFQVKSTICSAS